MRHVVTSPRSLTVKTRSRRPLPASTFPVVLRELRAAEGMSQRDLALFLGVSQTCITRWETGSRQPSRDELVRVGLLLRITWVLQ